MTITVFSLETGRPGDHSAQDIMSDSGLPPGSSARNLFFLGLAPRSAPLKSPAGFADLGLSVSSS